MTLRRRRTILVAFLVIAALLRLLFLGRPNFWADEDMSVETQYRTVSEIVAERRGRSKKINVEPPGYHILNKGVQIFVPTPMEAFHTRRGRFFLRFLSAAFGVLAVWFMVLLARRFTENNGAFLPPLLLATSFYAIYYSQENRPYSAVVALTILSTWLFVEAFIHHRHRLAAPYALAVAALCYLHYTAILAPIIHLAAFAVIAALRVEGAPHRVGGRDILAFFLAGACALVLFSPWIAHTLSIALKPSDYFISAQTPATRFPYFNPNLLVSCLAHWGCGGKASLVYLPLVALGLVSLFRRARAMAILALAFYLVPLTFLAFSPYSIYFEPRYLIVVFPMHQLLAGVGVWEAARLFGKAAARCGFAKKRPGQVNGALLILILAILLFMNARALHPYYARSIKCSSENTYEKDFCTTYIDPMDTRLDSS